MVKNLLKKGYRIIIEGAYRNAYNIAAIYKNFKIVKCLREYHKNIRSIANLCQIAREIQRNTKKVFISFLKADSRALISYNIVEAAAAN